MQPDKLNYKKMLDPDDEKPIQEARDAGAVLVTWDRVVREAAGGMTPYEALAKGEAKAIAEKNVIGQAEVAKLRRLTPYEMIRLGEAADKTVSMFQTYISVTRAEATKVRELRVELNYSWRAIARFFSACWGGTWGSNQIAGLVICEKAAKLLGEDFLKEPWN